jgi:hypothetical protein
MAMPVVNAARVPRPRKTKLCNPPDAAIRRVNCETQKAMSVTSTVAAMMVIIPLNNRPCVSMVTGRTTIDTAGAVVATDWASTSAPESCRRPNARSGDRAGGCFSRVVKDRAMASVRADMSRHASPVL